MVEDFKIAKIPTIHFGVGKIKILPEILKQFNGKALLIVSKFLSEQSDYISTLESEIRSQNGDFVRINVTGEPSTSSIDEIIKALRQESFGIVCAIGGGSVIDSGKAIAAMLVETGSIENYLEGVGKLKPSGNKIPFIAVPSTAGTGSEATKNAVICKIGAEGYKRSLRHDNFIPDLALVDPALSLSCSQEVTAASGMDAFTQLLESFLSLNANPFTDALALKGMEAINSSLLQVYKDGNNIDARTNMSFAAMISGICLANAGLGAVHGFASSLAGSFEIPHGVICGTLLAEVINSNIKTLINHRGSDTGLDKLAIVAGLFLPASGLRGKELIIEFGELLYRWTDALKIPKLGKYGVRQEDVSVIVQSTDIKYNPVKLSNTELQKILAERI